MFQHSEMAVRLRPWSCVIVEILLMHPRLQASNACGWLWPTDNENNSIDEDFYLQLEIYQLSTFNRGARASSCVCVCRCTFYILARWWLGTRNTGFSPHLHTSNHTNILIERITQSSIACYRLSSLSLDNLRAHTQSSNR